MIDLFAKELYIEKVRYMNAKIILNANIENKAAVYGGVRGTNLFSRHNIRHWQTVVDSGVRTGIELVR